MQVAVFMQYTYDTLFHRNNCKHLFIPPCSIPVRFVKSQYVDEFSFSTIYTLYLNRAGTTFGFPRRGWGQVKKCWIIYLQACLCHVIYFHDTVSPEVGFQVSSLSKTEQYDRFCAFKGVDLGYPKMFSSFIFF